MLNSLGGGIPFIKIGGKILKVNDISSFINHASASNVALCMADGSKYFFEKESEDFKALEFYLQILEDAGAIMDLKKIYDRKDVIISNLERLKQQLSEFPTNLDVGNSDNENVQKLKEYIKKKLENQ